jgi:hypothetical protein
VIRLHHLRHTHATLLLADGVPAKVVSERLGHANATIALTVYQHVHPGMGREAADRFAARHEGRPGPETRAHRAPDLQEHRGAMRCPRRDTLRTHTARDVSPLKNPPV